MRTREQETAGCAFRVKGEKEADTSDDGGGKMKSPGTREIAKRLAVLLLFVLFGFCVPGIAAPKKSDAAERSAS